MANRTPKTSAKRRRLQQPLRVDPRDELAFDTRALSSLLTELKSLSERSGAAISGAYARAASSFLHGTERLQDLNAERRFQQRSQARPSAGARVAVRALSSEATPSPRK